MSLSIPEQITKGDTLSWSEDVSKILYLANVEIQTIENVQYIIRGVSGGIDLDGTDQGDNVWGFNLNSVNSNELSEGDNLVQLQILHDGGQKYTCARERIVVLADLSTQTNFDPRTDDEKELEKVKAALLDFASTGVVEYYVGDRRQRNFTIEELRARKLELEQRIKLAKNPHWIGGRNVPVRFTNM